MEDAIDRLTDVLESMKRDLSDLVAEQVAQTTSLRLIADVLVDGAKIGGAFHR